MRVGVFGGRFDPPHYGHVLAAQHARQQMQLDLVVFVPSKTPPHKPTVASAQARYEMTHLATAYTKEFKASPLELTRAGVSYTVDTVKEISQLYKNAELFLILGWDACVSFPTWHCAHDIASRARLICCPRRTDALIAHHPYHPARDIYNEVLLFEKQLCDVCFPTVSERFSPNRFRRVFKDVFSMCTVPLPKVLPSSQTVLDVVAHIHLLSAVPTDISSTMVRKRLSHNQSVRYLVPEPVESYLVKHRPYRQPIHF